MNIAIFGLYTEGCKEYLKYFFEVLKQYQPVVSIYEPFYHTLKEKLNLDIQKESFFNTANDLPDNIDLMLSLGGDGTFLKTATIIRNKGVPVIGINTGRLGFLANIPPEDIKEALHDIFSKQFSLEKRSLIKLASPENVFNDFPYALNEVTIHKQDSAMITIHATINGEYMNSYWADGLIISTPTGSTAYSLSAGGPVVVPYCNNFIISPIAPHNLTVRPLIVPDKTEIKLNINARNSKFILTADSRSEIVDTSYEIKLVKANFCLNMLKLDHFSFYNTLRNKLMWGVDKRN